MKLYDQAAPLAVSSQEEDCVGATGNWPVVAPASFTQSGFSVKNDISIMQLLSVLLIATAVLSRADDNLDQQDPSSRSEPQDVAQESPAGSFAWFIEVF